MRCGSGQAGVLSSLQLVVGQAPQRIGRVNDDGQAVVGNDYEIELFVGLEGARAHADVGDAGAGGLEPGGRPAALDVNLVVGMVAVEGFGEHFGERLDGSGTDGAHGGLAFAQADDEKGDGREENEDGEKPFHGRKPLTAGYRPRASGTATATTAAPAVLGTSTTGQRQALPLRTATTTTTSTTSPITLGASNGNNNTDRDKPCPYERQLK